MRAHCGITSQDIVVYEYALMTGQCQDRISGRTLTAYLFELNVTLEVTSRRPEEKY